MPKDFVLRTHSIQEKEFETYEAAKARIYEITKEINQHLGMRVLESRTRYDMISGKYRIYVEYEEEKECS